MNNRQEEGKSRSLLNLEMVRHIDTKLMNGPGITRGEYEKIKNYHFGGGDDGWDVRGIIQANIDSHLIKWDGELLVKSFDSIHLNLEAERVLRNAVWGKKIDIHALVSAAVIRFFNQEDS